MTQGRRLGMTRTLSRNLEPVVRALALLVLAGLLAVSGGGLVRAAPVKTDHLSVELVSQQDALVPGGTSFVAIHHTIAPGWHTYWLNPGDSGLATKIRWTLPQGWSAGEIVWPVPERQRVANLMNYGYSGAAYLAVPISVPASARPGSAVTLRARVDFLVCADICIPESADVSLSVPIAEGAAKLDPKHGKALTRVLAEAPKPSALEARVTQTGVKGRLSIAGAELAGRDLNGAYFFASQGRQVVHTEVQTVEQGEAGLSLGLSLDKGFKPPLSGVLALADGTAFELSAAAGDPLPLTNGQPLRDADALDAEKAEAKQAAGLFPEGAAGLWLAAGAAFLGGLILNLMPCVFPVLSMKATALVRSGGDLSEARLHGLMFLAGVLVTFLGLAGILIAARAAGEAAGWGFQLQSPFTTGALALLMLAVALNMSKVFEAGLSVQSAGSELQAKGGLLGAFFTGALAVVVAAPCSAPFMAGAVGFALVQPALISLGIFAALGLGFAMPFVLLSLTPPLLRALPRPGPWMDGFRKLMAFPMYGAAAWMLWVFAEQTGGLALANLLTSALVLAFGLYLFGVWQREQAFGRSAVVALTASALSVAGALSLMVSGALMAPVASSGPVKAAPGKLESRPFSPQTLATLRAEGRPVLVNLTAAWCVTCKVNEQVALETRDVEQALKRTGTAYLVGDWTNRDEMIAAELARHGRSGVPLYLVYPAGGGAPEILPQLLTPGLVVKALERAEAPVRKPAVPASVASSAPAPSAPAPVKAEPEARSETPPAV